MRTFWRSIAEPPVEMPVETRRLPVSAVSEMARENLRRTYSEGLEHGSIEVLKRLVEKHPEGPEVVNRETREWARDCLARLATFDSSPR